MDGSRSLLTVFLAFFASLSVAQAQWSQWRGPQRTGVASILAPSGWPENLELAWSVPVGIGHSSPVVSRDRVFQLSREGEREVVRALSLDSGEILWERSYEARYTMNPAATAHGKGPKSTPLLAGDRVYTLGISGILSCLDASTGELIWQNDFKERFGATSPLYGSAMSPMLADGKLIVHLGGPDDGALMALEPTTGKPLWGEDADGPGYASPILVTLYGVEQVVTQTDAHIVGLRLDDGRLLWSLPFTTPYDQNVVTPLLHGDRLIFSGLEASTFAVELERREESFEPREVWRSPSTFYMSTPVLVDGRLLGFSNRRRGQFVALDADSGETLWESEGREGENAALVVWGRWLLALTDEGELLVMRAGAAELSVERRYSVASSPTWAHPAPTPRGILVKDESSLSLWRITAAAPSASVSR